VSSPKIRVSTSISSRMVDTSAWDFADPDRNPGIFARWSRSMTVSPSSYTYSWLLENAVVRFLAASA
jgi:hypothetical protein